MAKLTLSVDERVVRRAKRYAADQGTSISKLVGGFLDALSRPVEETEETPILKQIRGVISRGDEEDHRRHLRKKYL
jgi:hypothetical protein